MTTKLHITGMTCANCVKHVTHALSALPEVRQARVSLEDQSAVVEHTPEAKIESMLAAVEEEGYEAKVA